MNNSEEAGRLQFQKIKNKFSTYEERRDKMIANNFELLRSQVEPGYTPKYKTGAYIKPEAVVQYNDELDNSDNLWRFWAVNLEEATSKISVSFTVSRKGKSDISFTASDIAADVSLSDFLDAVVAGVGSNSPITVTKHCDLCLVIGTSDKSVITDVKAAIT